MFNVNVTGDNDTNLLHTACMNINTLPIDVFKLLIEKHGCDVNAQDKFDTPLYLALRWFNPETGGDITTLTYLLSHANLNIKYKFGCTLLHIACINKLPIEIFQYLIETQGCDVNVQDDGNDTPIYLALYHFNPRNGSDITVLTYLINQKGVNLNITNRNDHTLLHLACICEIEYYDDADYDSTNSDDDLDNSDDSVEAKSETSLCQVVEVIVETCLEQILDGTRF